MKRYIPIIILIFLFMMILIQKGWAQNTNLDYKYALKISNLSSFEQYYKIRNSGASSSSLHFSSDRLQILQPTVAFQWKGAKKHFHEIELRAFSSNKMGTSLVYRDDPSGNGILIGQEEVSSTYISMQYETITYYFTSKERNLVPSLGASLNPYYRRNKSSSDMASALPAREQFFGMRGFVTPRITYFINKKLFLDFNTPLCFFEAYFATDKLEHPTAPTSTYEYVFQQFPLFPKVFSARLGLGLKL